MKKVRKTIPLGTRFGQLTVVGFSHVDRNKHGHHTCVCDCGKTTTPVTGNLIQGISTSCGHDRHDKVAAVCRTHGATGTPEFSSFCAAKKRCTNPNTVGFKDYGGRGIEFRFDSFEDWFRELGPKPSPDHSVDRKNANGHYEPGNVRWATCMEQRHNRRVESNA